jgi:hypothetical protein
MTAPPPGAQLSPDGHYWWDETNQQWQPADEAQSATSGASDPNTSSDPIAQGGTAQAEQITVAGVCQSGELTDEEIAQVLSDAGVSVAEA